MIMVLTVLVVTVLVLQAVTLWVVFSAAIKFDYWRLKLENQILTQTVEQQTSINDCLDEILRLRRCTQSVRFLLIVYCEERLGNNPDPLLHDPLTRQ
jgi:hypothetical protein